MDEKECIKLLVSKKDLKILSEKAEKSGCRIEEYVLRLIKKSNASRP